jgi:predicted ATPase
MGTFLRGWALAMQEHSTAGMAQMRQGMAGCLSIGHTLWQPIFLTLLAEVAGQVGQVEEGLHLLAEALAMFEASELGDML